MSLRTIFTDGDVRELEAMRERARASLPPDLDAGWHHNLIQAERSIESFDLWLEDDVALQSHHHVSSHGIRGWVWASRGEVGDVDWAAASGENPPDRPIGALNSPLEAVGFEPGGWSYLCGSILARELEELGNTGAYARWEKLSICDGPAASISDDPNVWQAEVPADLRPVVIEDNNGVTVRLFVVRTDPLRVFRLDDWYRDGDLDPTLRQSLVARV